MTFHSDFLWLKTLKRFLHQSVASLRQSMWHPMDLVFRPSLPRNFGLGEQKGTGGLEKFHLEEFHDIRPKSYGRHFETALSIGINGLKYDNSTLLLSGCDIAFQVDVYE